MYAEVIITDSMMKMAIDGNYDLLFCPRITLTNDSDGKTPLDIETGNRRARHQARTATADDGFDAVGFGVLRSVAA